MRYFLLFLLCAVWYIEVSGQRPVDGLLTEDYTLNPDEEGMLSLSIDNLSFFSDSEFDGDIIDGYSLPGFRFNPRIIYRPLPIVKLEAGVSLLKFWGADKYPCYTYQDISEWMADDYRFGLHIQPFFRAQIQPVKQLNLVLGMLYGGANHRLIEPLYNRDLNFSADPETGAQILLNSRPLDLDCWINWESFTFKNDTHNEAFTVGVSSAFHITDPDAFFTLSLPAQGVMIHRGGELDTVVGSVSSQANAAAGIRIGLNPGRLLKRVSLEVMGVGYKEFYGDANIFSQGGAAYASLSATVWNFTCKLGWWNSRDFVNLFGNPMFGNVSLTIDGRTFRKPNLLTAGLDYEQRFASGIHLGAYAGCFYFPKLEVQNEPLTNQSFNFSCAVSVRINPSILLKLK
jgi:hypothetical protein